ncbi:MAP7 domain-containing protein 2 isoform X8 [Callorhinchus milii]|uniref:MAP7 domain-containing protein 3 n=1 Tax=Callorhinchus milii TaxID=7868 RepID=A0A4W3I6H5_CALMI|nr:MAP7 domain-containing protein 2 isoform X8 [Callorhinchus milii]|eukprot:gi/632935661/ref/XP_007890877.1/ PREDICTED: MAP7 domain-containing protein 3 isoform X8 [Callorhinchus milii]
MAEGATTLKGLRAQYVAAAQAQAEERRSQSVNSPTTEELPIIAKTPTKPVIDGSTLRTDERQRLAKERREEREKQIAARESQLLEKEKKARLQYEKQIEERQKKLEEQKQKEEQRRVAVEVKRKQKREEEKERYEAVIRRTLERSQRVEQRQKRWSWGGALSTENENSSGVENSLSPSLNLADCPPPSSEFQTSTTKDVSAIDKRSASTMNLVKQTEPVISKRLSSSSAVLIKSPERSSSSKKRSASLNRLGSKASQPPQSPQKVTQVEQPASASSMNSPINPPNKPLRSRSIDRQKVTSAAQTGETKPIETTQKQVEEKRPSSPSSPATRTGRRRSPSPANLSKRPPSPSTTAAKRPSSPSTIKSNPKNRPPSPSTFKQRPPSPTNVQKPLLIQRLPLTPTGGNATKKKTEKEGKPKQKNEVTGQEHGAGQTPEKEPSVAQSTKTKDSEQKTGTTTAEEAAKILAEKRRFAREQKEREEQEKLQREEAEKLRKEELVKKAAEESIRRKEEEHKEEEERKVKEEENQRLAEDERIRREQEEQEHLAELQQQREEAEAKALEEAERQKLERERVMQQNHQERLERKKRIDEIMKRTRKGDLSESKLDEKSDSPGLEDENNEDEPENEDLDNDEGTNGIRAFQDDSQLECGFETMPTVLSTRPAVDDVTDLNGVDKPNNIVNSLDGDQPMDVSPMPKEESESECLHLNEAEQSVGLESQNGKSSTWIFEEFIELGVHSKTTKLTVAARDADDCNQNLIDAGGVPENRIIALEENGGVTSLTKPLEATSALL